MIAYVAIFVTYNYGTILLCIFIILCIRSLYLIYYKFLSLNTITLISSPFPSSGSYHFNTLLSIGSIFLDSHV